MGQAKKRGTFEERKLIAIERNQLIELQLLPNAPQRVKNFAKRRGIQRLAGAMIAAGILPQLTKGK